jgi:hypothetical protein
MRKHDPDNINLDIKRINVYPGYSKNDVLVHDGAIVIQWESDIGFGEYSLRKDIAGNWIALSECMDREDDKSLLKKLLELFLEQIEVIE